MPTMGELSVPLSEPKFCAEPKAATVPLASASQYPVPLGVGAMADRASSPTRTAVASWPQLAVTSRRRRAALTKIAAMEPPV